MGTNVVSRKNQIRSILFVAILMIITVLVVLKDYSMFELARVIGSVHPFYLGAGMLMMFVNVGCLALNFRLILQRLGHSSKYMRCIEYAYVGNYFGAITPGASGAQPAQMYYMNKEEIHIDISAITVFLMVFTTQIVMLVYGGIMAILRFDAVCNYKPWMKYLIIAGSAVILCLTLVLLAIIFMRKTVPYLIRHALKLGVRMKLVKKEAEVREKLDALIASYQSRAQYILKHPGMFVEVFLISVIQWTAYYMVSYLVYLSFGHRSADVIDLMSGQVFINIAVLAVPLPGAVGISEKAFMHVFQRFYTREELPSAMILTRVINFYLPLFVAFLVYMAMHFRIIRKKEKS